MLLVSRFLRATWLPVAVVIVGTILSGAAAYAWKQWLRAESERRLEQEASEIEGKLSAQLQAYTALLRGGAGLFAAMPSVGRTDLYRYMQRVDLERNYPGIFGIGFSVRVPPDRVALLEEGARQEGIENFAIRPSGERSEYHAIVYLEPENERNRAAIGYDMSVDPVRRAAMERARRTGQPAATRRVTLVQEIDAAKQPGFLIYHPVYDVLDTPMTPEERYEHLLGFVYAPFRTIDFVRRVLGRNLRPQTSLTIYDGTATSDEAQLFREDHIGRTTGREILRNQRRLPVADVEWTLVYAVAVDGGILPPLAIFLGGLMLSATLGYFVQREHRALDLAARNEARSRDREDELALLIDAVPALVAYVDRNGRYRICNRTYEEWFARSRGQILGRTMRDVLGEAPYREIEPFVQRALAGEAVGFEHWQHFQGAGARYLATLFAPHRARNRQLNGFYLLASDLTEHKRAEEAARFVADSGKLLTASLDYENALRELVHLSVPRIADVAVLFRVNEGTLGAQAVAHAEPELERRLVEFLGQVRVPLGAANSAALAARTRETVVVSEVTEAHLARATDIPEEKEMLRLLRLRSTLHAPIVVRDEVWGVLSLGTSANSGRRFAARDRNLAEEITARVQLAVENALLHREAQQDIQERTRAETALRASEERFRTMADSAPVLIWLSGADGQRTWMNRQWLHFVGRAIEQERGEGWVDNVHPEERERCLQTYHEAFRARRPFAMEYRLRRRDGVYRWMFDNGVPLQRDGEFLGFIGSSLDMTERIETEQSLQLHGRVLDNMVEGVSLTDETGVIVYTNRAEDRIFGYRPGELIGLHVTVQNAYSPDENKRIVDEVLVLLRQRGFWEGEFKNRKKNGTVFFTHARITSLQLGGKNHFLCVQQDITEAKAAREALRETEERFRLLVEGARDYAIILLDAQGRITSWNQGATRILGYEESEVLGREVGTFFTREDQESGLPKRELALARDAGSASDERWYVRKDGSRFWGSEHVLALRTGETLRGYAKIMRDLTERKRAEEELEERVRQRTLELNDAVQELEAFSYTVSHDLRSPLRAIHGFTEVVLEEAAERLTAEEKNYLGRSQRAVARLDRLISDLLTFSRVSKNRVELQPVALEILVNDLVREHTAFQEPQADVHVEGPLLSVLGNEAYLTQCVTNLLGNAVKFVKRGEKPVVRVWTERHGERVRLYVQDRGIGIATEHLERVFEIFERLHVGSEYDGTGVGLAIVRRAVQRMNGTVGVSSVVGEGTTFWLELPAA